MQPPSILKIRDSDIQRPLSPLTVSGYSTAEAYTGNQDLGRKLSLRSAAPNKESSGMADSSGSSSNGEMENSCSGSGESVAKWIATVEEISKKKLTPEEIGQLQIIHSQTAPKRKMSERVDQTSGSSSSGSSSNRRKRVKKPKENEPEYNSMEDLPEDKQIGKEAVLSLTAKVKDKLCPQWKYATFQQIHDKKLDRYIAKYGGCNVDRKREVGETKEEHENAVRKEWAVFNRYKSAIQIIIKKEIQQQRSNILRYTRGFFMRYTGQQVDKKQRKVELMSTP